MHIPTTETEVFDIQAAIGQGFADDHKGANHAVVAHGPQSQFLITESDGIEYCFDADGKQFADFAKLKLTHPSRTLVKVFHYVVYDEEKMEILGWGKTRITANEIVKRHGGAAVIANTTHPKIIQKLAQMGVEKTRWYE